MNSVSVIIITKNEAVNIKSCIESARLISNDIIVIDSESNDETVSIAKYAGTKVVTISWQGYGAARNLGASVAQNDWILAIDADERVTTSLVSAIKNINDTNPLIIYGFKRQSYYIGKRIRFGEWGRDKVFRLYNRTQTSWDLSPVHENLIGANSTKKIIDGFISHFTVINDQQNKDKIRHYARLNAQKYFENGKKATIAKRFLSPAFSFIQTYILRLGFLDGREGLTIAKSTTKYVWLKYKILNELNKMG